MMDEMLSRMWVSYHDRLSQMDGRPVAPSTEPLAGSGRDRLPVIGRAMLLALVASLASLSLGTSLA